MRVAEAAVQRRSVIDRAGATGPIHYLGRLETTLTGRSQSQASACDSRSVAPPRSTAELQACRVASRRNARSIDQGVRLRYPELRQGPIAQQRTGGSPRALCRKRAP